MVENKLKKYKTSANFTEDLTPIRETYTCPNCHYVTTVVEEYIDWKNEYEKLKRHVYEKEALEKAEQTAQDLLSFEKLAELATALLNSTMGSSDTLLKRPPKLTEDEMNRLLELVGVPTNTESVPVPDMSIDEMKTAQKLVQESNDIRNEANRIMKTNKYRNHEAVQIRVRTIENLLATIENNRQNKLVMHFTLFTIAKNKSILPEVVVIQESPLFKEFIISIKKELISCNKELDQYYGDEKERLK